MRRRRRRRRRRRIRSNTPTDTAAHQPLSSSWVLAIPAMAKREELEKSSSPSLLFWLLPKLQLVSDAPWIDRQPNFQRRSSATTNAAGEGCGSGIGMSALSSCSVHSPLSPSLTNRCRHRGMRQRGTGTCLYHIQTRALSSTSEQN